VLRDRLQQSRVDVCLLLGGCQAWQADFLEALFDGVGLVEARAGSIVDGLDDGLGGCGLNND